MVVAFLDVTRQRELEEQLRQSNQTWSGSAATRSRWTPVNRRGGTSAASDREPVPGDDGERGAIVVMTDEEPA